MVYLPTFEYKKPIQQLPILEKIERYQFEIQKLEEINQSMIPNERKFYNIRQMIYYRKNRIEEINGNSKWIRPFGYCSYYRYRLENGRFKYTKPTQYISENEQYFRCINELLVLQSLTLKDISKFNLNYKNMVSYRLEKLFFIQQDRILRRNPIYEMKNKWV